MITHVPGPFERLIRRLCAKWTDWLDRRAVLKIVEKHDIKPPCQVVQEVVQTAVARTTLPGPDGPAATTRKEPSKRSKKTTAKVIQFDESGVVQSIANAIKSGRVSGSQREIARTFNVSKTTVLRAQRIAEMA